VAYWLLFTGLIRTLHSQKRINIVVSVILVTGCFEALYGLVETYSGSEHIWWFKKIAYRGDVTGTYINRNHFAGLMEMSLLLAAGFAVALAEKRKKIKTPLRVKRRLRVRMAAFLSGEQQFFKKTLIIFAGVVIGIGVIFSASRGGMLSAAAALLLMGLMLVVKRDHRKKGFVFLFLFVMTSVYSVQIGVEYPLERFKTFYASFEHRARYAQKTLDMFSDYPLAGVGIGNFQYAYPRYQAAEDKKAYLRHAHNDWAQLTAEAGIAGLCFLLAGLCFYVFRMIKLWRRRNDPYAVCLAVTAPAAMAAMAIHSYTDFNLHIPANCLILAAILAVGYSALHLERHGHRETMLYRYYKLPLRYKGGVALVFFLALICWSGSWTIRHFMAEAYCNTVTNSTLNRDQEPPVAEIEKAIAWDRYNAQYRFKLAQERMKIRDVERLNPDGTAEEKRAHQKKIIDALEEAVRLNPFNAEYHVRLGWEYTHRWQEPDYHQKWLPAADISMERGTYFAGEKNSHLHLELGNYWVMRSKTMDPAEQGWEPAWTRACWHYHKVLELETGRKRKQAVQEIRQHVWIFYPDEEFVLQAIEQG
jgi:O-antigen ligase